MIGKGDNMNKITKQTLKMIESVTCSDNCILEKSKDNRNVVRFEIDDKFKYIGSKYSVQRDLDKFIESVGRFDAQTVFIVFGLGAGEHILELIKQAANNKVLIIEPNLDVICLLKQNKYYEQLVFNDKIGIYFYNYEDINQTLNIFISNYEVSNLKVIPYANYNNLFNQEYDEIGKKLNIVIRNKKVEENTLKVFSKLFFSNFMRNIQQIGDSLSVNYLNNVYKGKPSIIVSAGPSLEKNINQLKDVQSSFVIISGPRTVRTLRERGIMPDFICAVDPQEYSYTIMKSEMDIGVPLVYSEAVNSELVKEYKGYKILISNEGMEKYIEYITGEKVDSLLQGGSVAHVCTGLAEYLGCSDVIFVGQDLAYTDDKFQAESTDVKNVDDWKANYENNKELWDKTKQHNIYVDDICGGKVRTSNLLDIYRQELEEIIKKCHDINFINATEGGANIKGTQIKTLKSVIEIYGNENIEKNNLINSISYEKFDNEFIKKRIKKIIVDLEKIKKSCIVGINNTKQMINFYSGNNNINIKKVLNELDKVDRKMDGIKEIGIVAYILSNVMNDIIVDEKYVEKSNESIEDKGRRIGLKAMALYKGTYNALEEAIPIIKKSIEEI